VRPLEPCENILRCFYYVKHEHHNWFLLLGCSIGLGSTTLLPCWRRRWWWSSPRQLFWRSPWITDPEIRWNILPSVGLRVASADHITSGSGGAPSRKCQHSTRHASAQNNEYLLTAPTLQVLGLPGLLHCCPFCHPPYPHLWLQHLYQPAGLHWSRCRSHTSGPPNPRQPPLWFMQGFPTIRPGCLDHRW